MLLLVACCYFWCCLCTTGNPSESERERERVRAAFASTPAVNKRPPAAAAAPHCPVLFSLFTFPSPLFCCLFSSGCHISCSHAAYMTRHCDGPKFPTATRRAPLAATHSNGPSLLPPFPPLSHSFAYHINSSGCLFFLSIVYFLVSVFSALLSDPEHSKKAKKSKNFDLLLLLFLCRLLLKA